MDSLRQNKVNSLLLKEMAAVDLDASTGYGRIQCAFKVTVKSDDETRRSSGDDLRVFHECGH